MGSRVAYPHLVARVLLHSALSAPHPAPLKGWWCGDAVSGGFPHLRTSPHLTLRRCGTAAREGARRCGVRRDFHQDYQET